MTHHDDQAPDTSDQSTAASSRSTSGPARRTVLAGAAWAAPAIVVATASPAMATSGSGTTTITATTADYAAGTGTVTFLLDPAPGSTPSAVVTYSEPATPAAPALTDLGASGTGRLYRFAFALDTPPTTTTDVTITITVSGYAMGSTVVTFAEAGALDTTFTGPGTGPNNAVLGITTQADGKILIGGSFTTYNRTTTTRIAQLYG